MPSWTGWKPSSDSQIPETPYNSSTMASFKSGYVGIVGRPNVGKSTLMNGLLQTKLSIVTPKAQTTRSKVVGILTGENYQAVFLDTPGYVLNPQHELHRLMIRRIEEVIDESDLVVLMVEPYGIKKGDLTILDLIKDRQKKAILAINKIDTIRKDELLPLMDEWSKLYDFLEYVPISALKLDGVDLLLDLIVKHLPEGEPLYPEDYITDRPERFFVAEIIREKIFQYYRQEIPYATAVEIDEFVEQDPEHGDKDYIRAIIYVEHDSQKGILIGKGGEAMKRVGMQARQEIEMFLGRPVHLELWVKVRKNWRKDLNFVRRLGY